jgi:hypothetical protein
MRHTIAFVVPTTAAAILIVIGISAYNGFAERRDFAAVIEQSRSASFDLSCASDGSLDKRGAGNCFDRNGYRFIREGLGTIIAKVAHDGSAEVVYRHNTADDGGTQADLHAARMALQDNR